MFNNSTTTETAQPLARKPIQPEKKTASQRAREVPSQLMPCLRRSIEDSMRAGRGVKACAAEYNATQPLVLETWLRAELRRMDLRLQAVEDRVLPGTRLKLVA